MYKCVRGRARAHTVGLVIDPDTEGSLKGNTMNLRMNRTAMQFPGYVAPAALAIAIAAGGAMAVSAPEDTKQPTKQQTKQSDRQPSNQTDRKSRDYSVDMDASLLHFARADTLIGSELRNTASESIGTISDFIVDRGSGHIEYAVVKSGDILGFGGKSIALPYEELRYMAASTSFQTGLSEEQLQRRTEFIPENWDTLEDRSWLDSASSWMSDEDDNRSDTAMRSAIKNGQQTKIDGRVTRVERKTYMGDEQVVLTVEDTEQERHTLILGPSWYVMGLEEQVRPGDEVELNTVSYNDDYIVTDGRVNRTRVSFRDAEGQGAWDAQETASGSRYVLLSDLSGMRVEMVGSTVGEIQTTVIEGGSGQVAMLALDPNENLFGLGDDLSLIPWSATSLRAGPYVLINGNETKLDRALKMPEDLDTLRTPSSVRNAYQVFGLEIPQFEARDQRRSNDYDDRNRDTMGRDKGQGDAWSNRSQVIKAIRDGKDVEIRGTYKGMTNASIIDGAPQARVIEIETDRGTQRLIVAPVWFSEHQKLNLESGDELTINAKQATINGREWLAVVDIESDENTWTFWENDRPIWSN